MTSIRALLGYTPIDIHAHLDHGTVGDRDTIVAPEQLHTHCITHPFIRKRYDTVGIDIVTVVEVFLIKTYTGSQFGDDLGHHIGEFQQHPLCAGGADQSGEFCPYALPCHMAQIAVTAVDGGGSVWVNVKFQLCGKAQTTEDAQCVLLKAAVGVTHAANEFPS